MTNPATATTDRFQFRLRKLLVVVMIFAVLLLSFVVPVKEEKYWIDAVTASTKTQTNVTFSFRMSPLLKSTPRVKSSALADWLAQKEGGLTYDWRFVGGRLTTIWGTSLAYECGIDQPIFSFSEDVSRDFVKSSSDEELRHFVDVMRHGTKQEQQAAVHAAFEKLDAE
jgi:hypothetical protein